MEKNLDIENMTPVTIDSAQQLRDVLNAYGVKTRTWDTPPHKDVNRLYDEVVAGESRIVHLGEQIGRLVSVVNVDVRATIGRRSFQLIEDRQDFIRGGETRSRGLRCVSEKIQGEEEPETAARRGLKEELGVDFAGLLVSAGEPETEAKSSSHSYPGLLSIYQKHLFTAQFGLAEWKPEGYVEYQLDKSTFFVWQELPS